jgi:uncharacterized protein YeaO (DUF488 family)
MLQIKRIYEAPDKADGFRILVDRLWPRGVSKERAAIDRWLKDVAPSPELRVWFSHDPKKFPEFRERYREELAHNPAVDELTKLIRDHHTVTLLYATKDSATNHAVVLQQFMQKNQTGV